MTSQIFNTPNFSELRQRLKKSGLGNTELLITEYEKFFFLIKKYPTLKAVPTKSIDTVWHFHLSNSQLYKKDCISYIGHIVPHKKATTKTELLDLKNNFRITNELWVLNFNSSIGDKNEIAVCGVGDNDGDDNGGGHGGNDY